MVVGKGTGTLLLCVVVHSNVAERCVTDGNESMFLAAAEVLSHSTVSQKTAGFPRPDFHLLAEFLHVKL